MKIIKGLVPSCLCGRNYAVKITKLAETPLCLKCNAWNYKNFVPVSIITPCYKLVTMNEPLFYPYDAYCDHRIGFLVEPDDTVAICLVCKTFCERGYDIKESSSGFIRHVLS